MTKAIQQNSTKVLTIFEPTPSMIKWLDSAMKLGYMASITDVSRESKVERTNWYKWIENPLFVEWWNKLWQKHLHSQRWKLDAIGMKKAESDYQYWKDMMAITGSPIPDPAQQQQNPVAQGGNVNIFGMSEDQIKRALGKE